ncbi:ABC transporter protein AbcA [Geobacter sp. OR-1]|uniref:ABC transporter ATP-binding protein n=1 Tax=Geobacter sp. OR-1 TaxID=1266765 RepID=UPI00054205DE|nr:ABC transporter ATP-binding protein [Geobacter sp. OR-1]GAM08930.1 ABC transporter protein AbcA [Geobacter sp. OR-1]
MSYDIAIKAENLSKVYKLYNSPVDRLKESLHPLRKQYHYDFYALNDVSFEIKKGETVGIIGKNGAGKSTLLKILTGVLTPTSGKVRVIGRVSALLELGAGFNPELSGIENIYFNGMLMGYTREEMEERLDDILSFADIGGFVQQPVKTYSSGMFVRLAFAVSINVAPDILIVDEALSVGDMFFQAKCMTKMKQLVDSGISLFFVSHSSSSIKSLCSKAILLEHGSVKAAGDSSKVVEKYFAMVVQSEQIIKSTGSELPIGGFGADSVFNQTANFIKRSAFQRIQNGKATFANVLLLDCDGQEVNVAEYNQMVTLRMAIVILEDIHELSYAYHIRDKNGVDIVYSSAGIENSRLSFPKKGERYVIDWQFELSLMENEYTISCVLSIPVYDELGKVEICDFIPIATQFAVAPRRPMKLYGLVHWPNEVMVTKL